ncbi:MAG: TauD/TfdA family dioxygenase [Thiotrichales bacterium]
MSMSSQSRNTSQPPSLLLDEDRYAQLRAAKLNALASGEATRLISLGDAELLPAETVNAVKQQVSRFNFALYALPATFAADKQWLLEFGAQLGLHRLDSNLCADPDSVTSLQVVDQGRHKGYIPYSNRPLNWHTDGYYNATDERIRGFILHCVQSAAEGGDNGLMDPELAYIRLRDENPAYIEALTHPRCMAIPPNNEGGKELRGWTEGPVFSLDPSSGALHMRYTARKRNIRWRDDPTTLEAVAFLQNLLTTDKNDVCWHRLSPGEGVVSNNVLHCRNHFTNSDEQQRLYYRARYYDRVTTTTQA